MKLNYLVFPIITILVVIAVYLGFQNAVLKSQSIEAGKRSEAAAAQRGDIESISKQNRSYTRCVAEIFARYTRDNKPVTNLNLDDCTTDSQTKVTDDTSSEGTTPDNQPATQNRPQTPDPQPSTKPQRTQTQSAPKPTQPKPQQEANLLNLNILGMEIKL